MISMQHIYASSFLFFLLFFVCLFFVYFIFYHGLHHKPLKQVGLRVTILTKWCQCKLEKETDGEHLNVISKMCLTE